MTTHRRALSIRLTAVVSMSLLACGSAGGDDQSVPASGSGGTSAGSGGSGGTSSSGGTGNIAGFGNAGGAAQGDADVCGELAIQLTRQIPTVVLLVDQSLSMDEPFGSGTRWTVVRDALLDPQSGLVVLLQDEIRFGLALYTSLDGYQGSACPMLVEVDCAMGSYSAIQAAYASAVPIDDTPTGESIDAVAAKLVAVQEPGPKYIVLATDGVPDTCEVPDDATSQQKAEAKAKSVAAAQSARTQGIQTSIIAIGPGVGTAHLQDVANAGAGLPVGGSDNAPFYEALDQASLVSAFESIIEGARSCVFALEGEVVPGAAGQGDVRLDGQPLAYGDANGWTLNSATELEILGDACDAIQSGGHEVTATFPCGAVVSVK